MLAVHVCFTVIVVIGAGLFVRTVQYGFSQGPGFDADHTIFAEVDLGNSYEINLLERTFRTKQDAAERGADSRLRAIEAVESRWREAAIPVIEGIRSDSRVQAVTLGLAPMGPDASTWMDSTQTFRTGNDLHALRSAHAYVTPEYFDAYESSQDVRSLRPTSANLAPHIQL
jgi:hypothetical protein